MSISSPHCHTFVLKNSNKTMKTLDISIFTANNGTVTCCFANKDKICLSVKFARMPFTMFEYKVTFFQEKYGMYLYINKVSNC